MVYVAPLKAPLESAKITIHPAHAAQITVLKQDEAPIKVPPKYTDYAEVFSLDLVMELSENTGINKHAIKLEKGKQPPYKLIYSLRLVELKTFKTYIKINLANWFIWRLKLLANALILFVYNFNNSLHLCVNYWELNNIII